MALGGCGPRVPSARPAGSIGAARGLHRRGRETRHWRTQSLNWAPVSWTRRRHMLAPRAQNRRRLERWPRRGWKCNRCGTSGGAPPGAAALGRAAQGLGTVRARHRAGSAQEWHRKGLGTARARPRSGTAKGSAPQGLGTPGERRRWGAGGAPHKRAGSREPPTTAWTQPPRGSWVQPSNAQERNAYCEVITAGTPEAQHASTRR